MQIAKQPLTEYVKSIKSAKQKNTLMTRIPEYEISHEAKKRMMKFWNVSKKQKTDLSFEDQIAETAKIYYLEKGSDLRISFEDKFRQEYEDEAIEAFLKEMSFIAAFCWVIPPKPSKKDLEQTVAEIKSIKKQLSALNKTVGKVRRTYEWFYIHDKYIEKYKELKGIDPDYDFFSISVQQFFSALSEVDTTFKNIKTGSLFTGYTARGRNQISRNSGLLALAESFELCFGRKPTSTQNSTKPNFSFCADYLLNLINPNQEIIDHNNEDIIKNTISAYNRIRNKTRGS